MTNHKVIQVTEIVAYVWQDTPNMKAHVAQYKERVA